MNTDTKILFETDLKFTHENKTLDFRANFPIPRTWLLIWDQIIQYQYRAFFETRFFDTFTTRSISHVHCTMYMCYWKYFMTKFAELFFRSEYRYWDFFQRPNMFWYWYRAFSPSQIFRYRYWYPQNYCGFSSNWILHYFPLFVRVSVCPCVTGVTSHISHIYKGINAM